MSADQPSAGFASLVCAFADFVGIDPPASDDALGLELALGDYTARVLPDPTDITRLLVEIDICPAGEIALPAFHMLHRLNYAGRFSHSWTACIDGDDTVVIYSRNDLATTDVGALEALIADGLNRAAALRNMWTHASNAGADINRAALHPGALLG